MAKTAKAEEVAATLEPFRRAQNPLELARAENLLRTRVRRNRTSPETVEAAAREIEKDHPDLAAAIRKTKAQPVTDASPYTVAQHRANLNNLIGDRASERKLTIGIYNCLIDILEVLGK